MLRKNMEKSIFRKIERMANIASTWPLKNNYKTLIMLYMFKIRPPDDQTGCATSNAFCVKKCSTCISKNQTSEFQAHFWHNKKLKIIKIARDVWSTTAFLIYYFHFVIHWKSMTKQSNFPSKLLLRSRNNASYVAPNSKHPKCFISNKHFKTKLILNILANMSLN